MKRNFIWGSIVLLFTFSGLFGQTDEFKPSGKINSQVFVDYYYVVSSDTATYSDTPIKNVSLQGAENTNAFKVRRIFLGYEYNFSPKISAMVRMESDETSLTDNGKSAFFMKDAYLKWNFIEGNTLIFGFQPTISFELSEKYWGHRFIDKTHLDLRNVVASRDLGVSLRGNVNDGKLRYNLMVGNNNSHKPESDRFKRIYGNVELKPMENGPEISVFADYAFKDKKNGKNVSEFNTGGFVGYKMGKFTAGIEAFYKIAPNSYFITSDTTAIKGLGISLFGIANITDKIGAFGRFDIFNPNTNSNAKGDSRNYIAAGIDFKPMSNIIISPNVLMETYEKYATTAGDYKPKSSVWARLTFYWLLK
jgi:hypothetical protein